MQLRKLSPADMQQIKSVWKTCFQDSDDFLDTYFSALVRVEDGIGFFDGDNLVSDLFTFNIDVNLSGMIYPSVFIAGCATLPEARNQHLMRDLIQAAISDMASRNISVCFLHPFLHSFYRKFGFETVAFVDQEVQVLDGSQPATVLHRARSLDTVPLDSVYASYRAYVSQFDSHFMRTRARMEAWLQLLFADGGEMIYLEAEDSTPYALYYPAADNPSMNDIFELVFFEDSQLQTLVAGTGLDARYFLPSRRQNKDASEHTMMRVIDPKALLQWYQYAPGTPSFVINIHDSFLGRDYNLLVTPGSGQAGITEVQTASDIVADITDVAAFCTGTYDSNAFPACQSIFRPASSCYFETY